MDGPEPLIRYTRRQAFGQEGYFCHECRTWVYGDDEWQSHMASAHPGQAAEDDGAYRQRMGLPTKG